MSGVTIEMLEAMIDSVQFDIIFIENDKVYLQKQFGKAKYNEIFEKRVKLFDKLKIARKAKQKGKITNFYIDEIQDITSAMFTKLYKDPDMISNDKHVIHKRRFYLKTRKYCEDVVKRLESIEE